MRYYLLAALLSAVWLDWRRQHQPAAKPARAGGRSWTELATLPVWIGFAIVFLAGTTPVVPRPWTFKEVLANPAVPVLFAIAGALVVQSLRRINQGARGADGGPQVTDTLRGWLSYGLAGVLVVGLAAGVSHGIPEFFLHGGAHLFQAAQGRLRSPSSAAWPPACRPWSAAQAVEARLGSRREAPRYPAAGSSA
jgi:hypothetical protein